MTSFITFAVAGLSILVSFLFILLLRSTRNLGSLDPKRITFNRHFAIGILIWTVLIWILGSNGLFAYHQGETIPRFLIPLFVPVLAVVGLMTTKNLQNTLNVIPLSSLVGFQFWRVFGSIFFLVALQGLGPKALMSSGYGDLITGTLAIVSYLLLKKKSKIAMASTWAFMVVGITDLLAVLYILLVNYPIWSDTMPSSAGAGTFPLILIVGIVAPVALIFHVFTIRKLLLSSKS